MARRAQSPRPGRLAIWGRQHPLSVAGLGGPFDRSPKSLLPFTVVSTYICSVSLLTMVINGAWNNRCGPGGSARRLHQFRRSTRRYPSWDDPRHGSMGAKQARHAW
jgi:hypothetical protein